MKEEIFTVDAFDITAQEGIDDIQYSVDYSSEEEALRAANEMIREYALYPDVINVSVYAGEYKNEKGEIWGERFDIYTVSNKDKETTMKAHQKYGYVRLDVDEYIA